MPVTKLTKRSVDGVSPADKSFILFDSELKGFGLRVLPSGAKSWIVEYRPGQGGRAVSKKRLSIGSVSTLTPEQARRKATEIVATVRLGGDPLAERAASRGALTLGHAWARYRDSHLQKKERSARTVSGMSDHLERLLGGWLDKPLADLGRHPERVAERHEKITRENGPYIANGTMRSLRAIYNYARKKMDRSLPPENPVDAVDWNPEERRQTGMGVADLPEWFEQLRAIRTRFGVSSTFSRSCPAAAPRRSRGHGWST